MTMPNTEARGFPADAENGQGGGSAREQIRDVKNQVVGQARNTLQQARDRATSSLGESKSQVADQFTTIAGALRRTTEHLRSEDQQRIAGLTDTVARQVEQVAKYLRDKDGRAIRTDLENLARRQPALVLGGALVLGLIGARFLKSSQRGGSRDRSYGRQQRLGYQEYNQPFSGGSETQRHMGASRSGREPGMNPGGGYAGA